MVTITVHVTQTGCRATEILAEVSDYLGTEFVPLDRSHGYFRIDESNAPAPRPAPRVHSAAPQHIAAIGSSPVPSNGHRRTARQGGDRDFQPF